MASGRRPRGVERWEVCRLPTEVEYGEGLCPPQKNFEIQLLKLRILVNFE